MLQVWLSFAQFEKNSDEPEFVKNTRQVYEEAASTLKNADEKEERLMILEAWQSFEVGQTLFFNDCLWHMLIC